MARKQARHVWGKLIRQRLFQQAGTMHDYVKMVRWLVDEVYPQAEYIRPVQSNRNTHTPGTLYETFASA